MKALRLSEVTYFTKINRGISLHSNSGSKLLHHAAFMKPITHHFKTTDTYLNL